MVNAVESRKKYERAVLGRISDFSIVFEDLAEQAPAAESWVTAQCPFHAGQERSFAFNRETGQWCCFDGCGKGTAYDYLAHTTGEGLEQTLLRLGDRCGVPRPSTPKRPPIREDLVQLWARNLSAIERMRQWLKEKRGLTDATLEKYQIGWNPKVQRFTIPVRDVRGNVANVRLYNATKDPKILNYTEGEHRYGSPPRLYGLDEMLKDEGRQVIVCEGELDRLILQQEGFMAVTSTHGCSVFQTEWAKHFRGKDVVLLFDCDSQGKQAAGRVLKTLQNAGALSVKNVVLPLRGDKDDKDVTDYLHKRGRTTADLQKLIDETPAHSYAARDENEEVIRLTSFTEIERPDLADKKVEVPITICGETTEAFHAVEEFRVAYCPRMQKGACFECAEMMVSARLPRGAQEYIGSCMSSDYQIKLMLRDRICKYGAGPTIEFLRRTTVRESFCHQCVSRITNVMDEKGGIANLIDGRKQELLEKKVYCLSEALPKPGNYLATGWVRPHIKTQQVTLLIESLVPLEQDYESFKVEEVIPSLQALRVIGVEGMVEDLTSNVTRIHERDQLLLAVLLTYCSPRWIKFNGEVIRGWIVSVIVGDAGSGKTQTYQRFADFVSVGDTLSGLTSTRTGLAYALVEHQQKGWQVRVGRYPANTRKILIVDETQHLPEWDLRAISKAMEEGFLQIDRVQSRGYESQTRLLMIANPRKDRIMDCFAFGCESLKTLFPPTITRRTDLAVFANAGDIKSLEFINQRADPGRRSRVTPEMLRALIYWTWNLGHDRIVFTPEAEELCLSKAEEVTERYGYATDIPLVTLADFRKKLARISAAFAALHVSANEDFSQLIVKPEHILQSVGFIRRIYSNDNCALDDYSDIQRIGSQLLDYEDIEKAFLDKFENERHDSSGSAYFPKAVFTLRNVEAIRREDLADQVGCSVDTISRIIHLLKRFCLIKSGPYGYVKEPKFNRFVRRFARAHEEFFQGVIPGALAGSKFQETWNDNGFTETGS